MTDKELRKRLEDEYIKCKHRKFNITESYDDLMFKYKKMLAEKCGEPKPGHYICYKYGQLKDGDCWKDCLREMLLKDFPEELFEYVKELLFPSYDIANINLETLIMDWEESKKEQ